MIDMDYILNGKKPKKDKGKKQQPKDPLQDLFSMFKGKGHPNPTDKKTPQQKQFLQKTKLGSGKSIKRFADKDKDGVINGLDCRPKMRKKHYSKQLLTPQQKQAIAESQDVDEAYDKLEGGVCWGPCSPIATKFHQKEGGGQVKEFKANWRGSGPGNHVVYTKGGQVYDPINQFRGSVDEYKEKYGVEDEKDITEHSR